MQWTDICNTRCSILSRFSHFHVSHFPPCNLVPNFHVPQFHVSHFQRPRAGPRCSRAWVEIAASMLLGISLRHTVHTHRASVHQTAKLVAVLLMVARVTAGPAESNCSLPLGLWLMSPAGRLPRTGISFGTLLSVIEYRLPLSFYCRSCGRCLIGSTMVSCWAQPRHSRLSMKHPSWQ